MEKFTFYKSWAEIFFEIKEDDTELALKLVSAILNYGIYGIDDSDSLPRSERRTFKLMMQTLKRNETLKENGQKGGAPEGNQNAKKPPLYVMNEQNNQRLNEKQPEVEGQNNHYTNNYTNTRNQKPITNTDNQKPVPSTKTSPHNQNHMPEPIANSFEHLPDTSAAAADSEENAAAAFEAEIQQEETEQLFEEVIKSYTASGVFLTSSSFDELRGYFDYGMEPEVLAEAAKRAADAGKATWKYTRGILQSWAKAKVLTLEDVRREDASYARKKAAAVASKNHSGDRPPASAYAPIYDGGDSGISGYIGRDDDISDYKTGGIS